jgi:hypothetical protein
MDAPQETVEKLLNDIENGAVTTLEQVADAFRSIHDNYPVYEWAWVTGVLQQRICKSIDRVTAKDIIDLVARWKSAVVELDQMLYADAKKEFAAPAQIGFGVDGDEASRKADFEQVRGTFDRNGFVHEIEEHIARKTALGDELIASLQKIQLSPTLKQN